MVALNQKLITRNFKLAQGRKIEYIVIHNTATPGATAENEYKYFSTDGREASAHYFIDYTQILRLVANKNIAWHVGDGNGKYGITNANSIGIEMCEIPGHQREIEEITINFVIELMKELNVPLLKVVRHYDASRKNCPRLLNTDGKWTKWIEFKKKLKNKLEGISNS
jgi:N-acetylmuramoyl-L-alanine amidase CwlA